MEDENPFEHREFIKSIQPWILDLTAQTLRDNCMREGLILDQQQLKKLQGIEKAYGESTHNQEILNIIQPQEQDGYIKLCEVVKRMNFIKRYKQMIALLPTTSPAATATARAVGTRASTRAASRAATTMATGDYGDKSVATDAGAPILTKGADPDEVERRHESLFASLWGLRTGVKILISAIVVGGIGSSIAYASMGKQQPGSEPPASRNSLHSSDNQQTGSVQTGSSFRLLNGHKHLGDYNLLELAKRISKIILAEEVEFADWAVQYCEKGGSTSNILTLYLRKYRGGQLVGCENWHDILCVLDYLSQQSNGPNIQTVYEKLADLRPNEKDRQDLVAIFQSPDVVRSTR